MNVDFVFEDPYFRKFKSAGDHVGYWKVNGVMKIIYNQQIYELNVFASFENFGEMREDPEYRWSFIAQETYAEKGFWRLYSNKNAFLIRKIPSMLWKDESLLLDKIEKEMETWFEQFTSFVLKKELVVSVPVMKDIIVIKKEDNEFVFSYSIKGRKGTFTSSLEFFYDEEDSYYEWEFSGIQKEGKIIGSNFASYEDHVFAQCVDIIKKLDSNRIRMLTGTHEYGWRFPLFQKRTYSIEYSKIEFNKKEKGGWKR